MRFCIDCTLMMYDKINGHNYMCHCVKNESPWTIIKCNFENIQVKGCNINTLLMANAYTVIWVCWGGRRKVRECVSGFINMDLSQERCHIYWEWKQGCEGCKPILWAVFLWNWFWKAVFVIFYTQVYNSASYWTDCPSKPCFHSCQIKKMVSAVTKVHWG